VTPATARQVAEFRQGLTDRDIRYVVATTSSTTVQPGEVVPVAKPYHARPADDDRPLATTSIATVITEIHEPVAAQPVTATAPASAPPPADRPRQTPPPRAPQPLTPSSATAASTNAGSTAADDPPARPAPTPDEILDLLRSDPYRPWHGRDVAKILNVTNINSLCTRMSQWAHRGLLHKIGRATYTLAPSP